MEEGTRKLGAYASAKAEDPKSVCSRAGFDWEEGEQDYRMRGEGNWGAERRRSGRRPTRVDRVAVGSGNRGASGETDERNGRNSPGWVCLLRIGPVECRG